ncbi:MAG TPA: glycosyltransferase family 61 protein [Acidimicrobiia bacterium]|nr:glycosyltransferase family 61 protein [Acidimicrobiia bacterium]
MAINTHDRRGAFSARLHSFLKRHPRLRQGTLSAYTTADRWWARARRPRFVATPRPMPMASSAEWVASFEGAVGDPSFAVIGHPESIINQPPKSLHGSLDPEYERAHSGEIPAAFVLTVPRGRVVGEHGAIVTPDHRLLLDVSKPVGSLRSNMLGDHGTIPGRDEFFVDAALPSRHVAGSVAVISAFVGRGYFHWLWDVLPRLGLLEEAGNSLDSIDWFVVPGYFAGFQIETLSALGIERARVISSLQHRNVEAERLLVPSLPRATGLVPTWAVDYLRRAFPPSRPSGTEFPQRIYIVRKATDHGILESEDQLTSRLKKRGFVPMAMENFTLREKAWLLGRAEAIVGPSGAGLCNIVFCQPGTKIVEIRVQPYPVMEPWDIANRCGLDFYDVLPVGYGQSSKAMVTTGRVADDEIMATLDMAGL